MNFEIKEMMIERTSHEILERAQGQDYSIIELRLERLKELKTEVGQAVAQELLMTREAEREVYKKNMQEEKTQGDEISIRRLEVLDAQIGRLRVEVSRRILIPDEKV